MATIYDLKPKFQNLLRPITRALAKAGVTANQVTLAACAMSFAAGGLLAWRIDDRRVLFLIPLVLFLRMALNAIDGMLAREHGMKSKLGGILNELTDVLSDSALYLPFALLPDICPIQVVIIVLLAVMTEMTGVVAQTIGASRRYDGPVGKSDRAFLFSVVAVLLGIGIRPGPWLDIVFFIVLLGLVLTIINRARRALKEAA